MVHASKLIGLAVTFLAGFRVGRNLNGEARAVTVCHQVAAVRPQTAAQAELAMARREQMILRETDLIGAAAVMAMALQDRGGPNSSGGPNDSDSENERYRRNVESAQCSFIAAAEAVGLHGAHHLAENSGRFPHGLLRAAGIGLVAHGVYEQIHCYQIRNGH
jgi:hypothetical protein